MSNDLSQLKYLQTRNVDKNLIYEEISLELSFNLLKYPIFPIADICVA